MVTTFVSFCGFEFASLSIMAATGCKETKNIYICALFFQNPQICFGLLVTVLFTNEMKQINGLCA